MKKSKKAITLTVILSVIIIVISLFTIHYFVNKKDVSEIENIEIITGSGFPICVYLKEKMWYNKKYGNKNKRNRKISAERLERAMPKKQGIGKRQRDKNS